MGRRSFMKILLAFFLSLTIRVKSVSGQTRDPGYGLAFDGQSGYFGDGWYFQDITSDEVQKKLEFRLLFPFIAKSLLRSD